MLFFYANGPRVAKFIMLWCCGPVRQDIMGCCDRMVSPYYRGNSGEIFVEFPSVQHSRTNVFKGGRMLHLGKFFVDAQ